VALWVLGLAGPLGGLIGGFGVARGLSRSVAQLSVRLNDLHSELDQQVGSVRLAAGGDLNALDRQLDRVVARVHGVVEQLQLREREALRAEQLAAVGRLAAGMAHNIRNPLTAVKLLISAAIKGGPGRELTPEDLRVIHGEVTRLEQTVEGLLDQGVTVEATLPAGPVPAAWDRGTLGMALLNLLWNALDSMPDGGRLRVSLEHGGSALRVQVRDTGPGISAEVRDRLFTPFASTKSGGTGLGLATCRRVVEQHGGTVEGHDDPAGGAVFTVTLPAGES
jgi:signal transduction histidine kinase